MPSFNPLAKRDCHQLCWATSTSKILPLASAFWNSLLLLPKKFIVKSLAFLNNATLFINDFLLLIRATSPILANSASFLAILASAKVFITFLKFWSSASHVSLNMASLKMYPLCISPYNPAITPRAAIPDILSLTPAFLKVLYVSWADVAAIYPNAIAEPTFCAFCLSANFNHFWEALIIFLCWNNCPAESTIICPTFSKEKNLFIPSLDVELSNLLK